MPEPQDPAEILAQSPGSSALELSNARRAAEIDPAVRLGLIVDSSPNLQQQQSARLLDIQSKTGLPMDVVETHSDYLDGQIRGGKIDPTKLAQESPIVAEWMAQSQHHTGAAFEDLTNLGTMESLWRGITGSMKRAQLHTQARRLQEEYYRQGGLEGDKAQQLANLLNEADQTYIPGGWSGTIGSFAGQMAEPFRQGARRAVEGAIVVGAAGATAGTLAGPGGTLAGGLTGGAEGALLFGISGFASQIYDQAAGDAWAQADLWTDKEGKPLSPTAKEGYAFFVGLTSAATAYIGEGVIVAPLKSLLPKFIQEAAFESLKRPTTQAAYSNFIKSYATAVGANVAFSTAQEGANIIAETVAKMSQEGDFATILNSPEERANARNRLSAVIGDTIIGMAAIGPIAPGIRSLHGLRMARTANNIVSAVHAAGKAGAETRLAKSLPSAIQELTDRMAAESGVNVLHQPIDHFNETVSKLGEDPREVAKQITGSYEAYDHAKATGTDIPIKTSDWATKIAPSKLGDEFAKEVRVSEGAYNAREMDAILSERVKRSQEEAAVESQPLSKDWQQFKDDIHKELLAIKAEKTSANAYAATFADFFRNMGERSGTSPKDLLPTFEAANAERNKIPLTKTGKPDFTATEVAKVANDPTAIDLIPKAIRENGNPAAMWRAMAEVQKAQESGKPIPELDHRGFPVDSVLRQGNKELRGEYDISKAIIRVYDAMNASTLGHEFGHHMLFVMDRLAKKQMAMMTPGEIAAKGSIAHDMGLILNYLGADSFEKLTRDQHEKFAKTFEKYLHDGKAPSERLRDAFATLRSFLLGIYGVAAKALGINALTPEIRSVFDRMLASEKEIREVEEIDHIQSLFATAEDMGKTPEEFAAYEKAMRDAHNAAVAKVQAAQEKRLLREQQQEWKDELAQEEEAARQELGKNPVYQARSIMRDGKNPDGTPSDKAGVKLDSAALEALYGKNKKLLRTLAPLTAKEGGVTPEFAATIFGADSADALIKGLGEAPPMEVASAQMAADRMRAKYPDMNLSGDIVEEARKAVHSEGFADVVRAEISAARKLEKASRPVVKQAVEAAKEQADLRVANEQAKGQARLENLKEKIAEGKWADKVQDALGWQVLKDNLPSKKAVERHVANLIQSLSWQQMRPDAYRSASRRSRGKAIVAIRSRDYAKAGDHLTEHLIQEELYRASLDRRAELEAARDYMLGFDKKSLRQTIGKASGWVWTVRDNAANVVKQYAEEGPAEKHAKEIGGFVDKGNNYLAIIDELRSKVGLKTESWASRADALVVAMKDPEIASLLGGKDLETFYLKSGVTHNWADIPSQLLFAVRDNIKHVEHMARIKEKLMREGKTASLKEIEATLRANAERFADRSETAEYGEKPYIKSTLKGASGFFTAHVTLGRLLRKMDGWKEGGAFSQEILFPLNEAFTKIADGNAYFTKKIRDVFFDKLGKYELANPFSEWHAKRIRETLKTRNAPNGEVLSKSDVLGMFLNYGNKEGRDRLLSQFDGNELGIKQLFDEVLTADDMKAAQEYINVIGELWPQIRDKERRVRGTDPVKVEALPIVTKHGTFDGGYYPLAYDSDHATKSFDHELTSEVGRGRFARMMTDRGHTETRIEHYDEALRLDLHAGHEHIQNALRDLHLHEYLIDASRLIRALEGDIKKHFGNPTFDEIKNALIAVAQGEEAAKGQADRLANRIRTGSTYAVMALNVTNALMNTTGLPIAIKRVGVEHFNKAVLQVFTGVDGMERGASFVLAKSKQMANRHATRNRELYELSGKTGPTALMEPMNQVAFWMEHKSQMLVEIPTWLGEYNKALEGGFTDHEAVNMADQAVKDIGGGGQVHDQASILRGGPWKKLFTAFGSYFVNAVFGGIYEAGHKWGTAKDPMRHARLAGDLALIVSAPVVMGMAINAAIGKQSKQDQKNSLKERLFWEHLTYLSGTTIGIRELSGALHGFAGYDGPAGARLFGEGSKFITTIRTILEDSKDGSLKKDYREELLKEANRLGGILFRYPSGQLEKSIRGFNALMDGKTTNAAALFVGPPPQH